MIQMATWPSEQNVQCVKTTQLYLQAASWDAGSLQASHHPVSLNGVCLPKLAAASICVVAIFQPDDGVCKVVFVK